MYFPTAAIVKSKHISEQITIMYWYILIPIADQLPVKMIRKNKNKIKYSCPSVKKKETEASQKYLKSSIKIKTMINMATLYNVH